VPKSTPALWVIHSRFPQIPLATIAMDISADSVARAEVGRYKPHGVELTRPLDVDTLGSLFDRDGDDLVIKSALRQNIRWLVADAMAPGHGELAWHSGRGAGQQFFDSHE
jgi:chemotaxis methyl-accepting protein methylase